MSVATLRVMCPECGGRLQGPIRDGDWLCKNSIEPMIKDDPYWVKVLIGGMPVGPYHEELNPSEEVEP